VGSVVDAGGGTWSWSFNTTDGPTESQTVTITGTDQLAQSTDVTFDLVVNNVAPTVTIDPAQTTTIDENTTLSVAASFTDPGTADTHTATITCHTVGGSYNVTGTVDQTAHTVSGDCPYGDDSAPTFDVTVTVTDDDGGAGSDDFDLTVNNVDPDASINTAGLTLINGVPTVIAQTGDPLTFEGDADDPGSDDLNFLWDWDDGTTTSTDYLVNSPATDPLPSPDVDPRDVNDSQMHTYLTACAYVVDLTVADDDGGDDSDQVNVIIGGNSGQARSAGYWMTEYRGNKSQVDVATLDCYLAIAGFMSAVFDEEVDASTQNKAAKVLMPTGKPDIRELLDVQLLAAWINFANGAFGWTDLVDTDGDKVPDTAFDTAILAAEAVRLNPAATGSELEAQKNVLEWINTMHE
jgi:hypothetical protein